MEDNQTLFDIIQNALDETLKATGQMYVLYDLSLIHISNSTKGSLFKAAQMPSTTVRAVDSRP